MRRKSKGDREKVVRRVGKKKKEKKGQCSFIYTQDRVNNKSPQECSKYSYLIFLKVGLRKNNFSHDALWT